MPQLSTDDTNLHRRYALCVGIGQYTQLRNRNLRYAVADATTIAERLADPQRGNFVVTLLTLPAQTSKAALDEAVEQLLSAPDRQPEDLTLIYFSCHGDVYAEDNTFCLLPSNAARQADGSFEQATLISIYDLARWFSKARTHNIVMLLDVCHSGGAGVAFQHFKLNLSVDLNFFILGGARQDQITTQNSRLQHGLFTHCLLRAFEQPPTKDGWLTLSQIHTFVSEEIPWFAKDQAIQPQSWSVSVNPNLPLTAKSGLPRTLSLAASLECSLAAKYVLHWTRGLIVPTGKHVAKQSEDGVDTTPGHYWFGGNWQNAIGSGVCVSASPGLSCRFVGTCRYT